jgi:hypothetical protein
MKCHFCKDKATKSIDVTHNPDFGSDEDEVFVSDGVTTVYDSQGTFRPWVEGDSPFSLRESEERNRLPAAGEEADDEEKTEVYVCEDHYRWWELEYGGEPVEAAEGGGEELEDKTKEVQEEIEQIKERIRKKNQKINPTN